MAKGSQSQAPAQAEHAPGGKPLTGGSWRPWVENEALVCNLVRLRSGDKGFIVDLTLDDGTQIAASAPKMLADALDGVEEGARLSIIYRGKKAAKKGGKEYSVFDVRKY